MKKIWVIPLLAILLAGCSKNRVLETVSDIPVAPAAATALRIQMHLPPELAAPVLQDENAGSLYLCDDYSLSVHTVQAGDLKKTIRNATGMEKDDLDIMQTKKGNAKCYQWVWTVAGESGVQVGRGCVLDDGTYHYVLTVLADEKKAWEVQPVWKEIFTSFTLATEREPISTGS